MDPQKLKTTLEVTTNIAVILVAVAMLSLLAIFVFVKPRTPTLSIGLQKGQAFGQISKVDYGRSDRTLLIALSTACSYCQENLPFYQKLTSAPVPFHNNLQVVALFPNAAEDVEKYVRENKLPIEAVAAVDFNSLRISGTPTIILVDKNGVVQDFWIGKLSEQEANKFLHLVSPRNETLQ